MRISKPVILTVLAAGALGGAMETGATPAELPPGGSVNPIPTFSGTGTPTHDILADTGLQMATENGMTVQFEEWAVKTDLNPSGLVFAFAIETSNDPMSSLSATLPGYSGFMTSVEACDPFSSASTCGTATGMAARSDGMGDTLTFSSLGTTPVSPPGGSPTWFSNLNGVFTNASGFVDPQVTVMDNGTRFLFDGIAPKTTSSVPEPATFGLLALGLLGSGLARGRRRR